MIQVRLAAPRRAARVTGLILGAALVRALLFPLGDLFSTIIFAGCLLAITWFGNFSPPFAGEGRVGALARAGAMGTVRALVAGLMVGAILLAPVATGSLSSRPWGAFLPWAAIATLVATLEETSIRGVLYRRWEGEAGTVAAIVVGAAVFALIHLPRYGLGAMPLDAAVGLALGGLRALTGRVWPCVVAHTVADWGAWFWA
ncbi:MAG TPA: CPBP family intramembrane glutamic endopeptidase [Candidatus Dormibacteraeota bacterium]|nr:CPBP family intramembrane glutamic endopeptidase [Candidatus Dormibacteraeota bacterium]